MPRNKTSRGFTMVELIVVIAILAIVAAIVIPSASSGKDIEAVAAARIIASDLQYAQNMAITYRDPVTVTFNQSSESYSLTNTSGALIHPITKNTYSVVFTAKKGFEDLDIVSAAFTGGQVVTFDELGTPDKPGSITLQAGPHVYRVNVAPATGRVTVTNL